MAMSFDSVNSTLSSVVKNAETSLQAEIAKLDATTASPTQMLMLQQEISKWTMLNEIQSTIVKQLSDTMKGIIQKSN